MHSREDLLAQVAVMFYEEKITQSKIAEILNISRPTVAKLLKEAQEKKIVDIFIQHPKSRIYKNQLDIQKKYSLDTVLISTNSKNNSKRDIGYLAAKLIESKVKNINSIGISWGSTIYELVSAARYSDFKNLDIIPLIGGMGINNTEIHSNHLAFILAQKYNANAKYFYAPAFAESVEIKRYFEESNLVSNILELGRNVDLAVLGIGNPQKSNTYKKLGYITQTEFKELKKKNIIGDVSTAFFDNSGNQIQTSVSDKMIGLDLEDLKKIPEVIVLASGTDKTDSIKALLKKNIINHLVIDQEIADGLLT